MTELPNPYIRLLKLTGLTQSEFGKLHDFGPTTMTYIASGQFADLSDRMVLALGQEITSRGIDAAGILQDEYGTTGLQEAYHRWQSADRRHYGSLLTEVAWPNPKNSKHSPMHYLVKDSSGSYQGFCKRFHISSATLDRYAHGVTRSMPWNIRQALIEAGYKKIDALATAMDDWNDRA